jgi:hypothetical protein
MRISLKVSFDFGGFLKKIKNKVNIQKIAKKVQPVSKA